MKKKQPLHIIKDCEMVDYGKRSICNSLRSLEARSLLSQCSVYQNNGSQTAKVYFRISTAK